MRKPALAVLAMVGAMMVSAPLSAQAKPDWSKLPPSATVPANQVAPAQTTNQIAPKPAAPKPAANDTQAPAPAAKPAAPPVRQAPGDLDFPKLTGRVVDEAGLLTPEQVADLTSKSEALEAATGRQFVIATVDSLDGRNIEDYGYQLGRAWGIGDEQRDDGVILLVAPNERKVRIETGYGARVFLTDAVSSVIVRESILPAFRNGDMGGGVVAGADQIVGVMQMSPEEAAKYAQQAQTQETQRGEEVNWIAVVFWVFIFFFVIMPIVRTMFGGGRRYKGKGRRGGGPVVIWGPGWGGGSGGGWGGGGFGGGGGGFGGGFSGGGGSFGGGGASGSW